jgi:hypothetical protein
MNPKQEQRRNLLGVSWRLMGLGLTVAQRPSAACLDSLDHLSRKVQRAQVALFQ